MDEGYDRVNVARARDLLAGRRLARLPAEAFDLPGSRSKGVAPATGDEGPGKSAPLAPAAPAAAAPSEAAPR